MARTEEARVRELIERWAAAISGEDRAGILAHHSDNLPRVVELRLTTGLRKINGEWVVTHEHHSVPTWRADSSRTATRPDRGAG